MEKHGLRVMDSDLPTMEPDDLWTRYLDEPLRKFAPRFVRSSEGSPDCARLYPRAMPAGQWAAGR